MRPAVCALAILFAATPALADWEYTHWGMTPEQVATASSGTVQVLPKSERTDTGDHSEIAAMGNFKMGGRTLSVGFQFNTVTNGLECVLYNASGNDVAMVKDMLIKKYGPTEERPFATAYSMVWKTPELVELAVNGKPLAAVVNHCKVGQANWRAPADLSMADR